MKRIFLLLLAVMMLTGCGTPPEEETRTEETTTQPTEPMTEPAPPVELLLPEECGDALTAYGTLGESYEILPVTDGVLMFVPEGEQTRVLYLQGEKLTCIAETVTEKTHPDRWTIHNAGTGFARYSESEKSVAFYNNDLQLKKTVGLPGENGGNAVVSGDFTAVYFSTGTDLMAFDVAQGLARPLRIGGEGTKKPLGLTGGDSLLLYEESYPERTEFCLINTTDGLTVQTITKNQVWKADDTRYYVLNGENFLQFASYDDKKWELDLAETARITALHTQSAKLLATDGNTVSLYDLQTGTMTAKILLPEGVADVAAAFGPDGVRVWLSAKDRLYLWDTTLSPTNDRTVYTKRVR